MDVQKTIGGSLQISTEVLAKIARLAALEIDGVAEVTTGGSQNVRGLLGRTGLQKPVNVVLEDGIATVTVHLTAVYGSKIMPLCEKVQENVKQTIQNMTGITVARVPRVSLVALRLGLAEMLYGEEQKTGVAINEAVELVKKYGADNDYQFVNGLLGAVARERGEQPVAEAAQPQC